MAQLINEIKRMQFLAGLITEAEQNTPASEEKAIDQIEKNINSSQAQATLQKMADKLSDEDKQRIMKFISSVNESEAGTEVPDLEDVAKKLMALTENNGPQDPQNRSTAVNILGQIGLGAPVVAMGAGLIKGILVGGAAAGLAAATPFFAAAAAGAVLIGLAKIIFRKKSAPSNNVGGVNVISNPIVRKKINENSKYTIHLQIDGKTVMSRESDKGLNATELSANLVALQSKYKDKYDFSKAKLVVFDPSGKNVGTWDQRDEKRLKGDPDRQDKRGWPYTGGSNFGDSGASGFYEGKD